MPRHRHPSRIPMIHSPAMQQPTLVNMHVRNVRDAKIILHAVALGLLPMLRRRLDDEERVALRPGFIYVWEERNSNPHESNSLESIQRFTDGRSWGPSKARECVRRRLSRTPPVDHSHSDFLLYYEKESTSRAALLHRSHGFE